MVSPRKKSLKPGAICCNKLNCFLILVSLGCFASMFHTSQVSGSLWDEQCSCPEDAAYQKQQAAGAVDVTGAASIADDKANENETINAGTDTNANADRFALATKESLGFFDDIDEARWKRMKDRFHSTRPNEARDKGSKNYREHANHPTYFWMENFDPEFSCENEMKYGRFGDGGKWICDTHRIKKTDCLVYSVGSRGEFSFEKDIRDALDCEVHTFDRDNYFNRKNFTLIAERMGVHFHHTSLGSATDRVPNGKRFREIIPDLKHEGKTVDIMKIDCEGCEWDQYLEWFEDWKEMKITVRQLIIEVHNSPLPQAPDFFYKLWEQGFVIFHKEANALDTKAIEYAFILLDPEFQKKVE